MFRSIHSLNSTIYPTSTSQNFQIMIQIESLNHCNAIIPALKTYRYPVRSSHICSMELACSIMAFVHDSSVLYVLQYRFVMFEYRFLSSLPCTLSINKPSVYFSPFTRKERVSPSRPVSLSRAFSPTLLELYFSDLMSRY